MSPHDPPPPLAILVVDDDADAGDSLAELLALYGHTVRIARGGEDALRQAAADPPDVVLLDVLMPQTDGCEVARLLRERAAGAKRPLLVAVTGCGSADDRVRTHDAGFDLHLVKPVEPGLMVGLLERFRRLLGPAQPRPPLEPAAARPDAHSPDSPDSPDSPPRCRR